MKKSRVLFLCTGNSARSQMAEGLLRWHGNGYFEVFSAGLEPKGIHPLTIQVMNEMGYDMRGHRSKSMNEYIGRKDFDYLITVCSEADEKCPIFPGMGTRLHWGFEDPAAFEGTAEEKLKKFRQIRNQIDLKILEWLTELGLPANP
jgi:arsenate reductase (thioredoxin)